MIEKLEEVIKELQEPRDYYKEFIKEEIYSYLNNQEGQEYVNLTDKECDEIVNNCVDSIMLDNTMSDVIGSTIMEYTENYMYNKGLKNESEMNENE
jgi:uncharacterized FlaG/YvyC family protein